MTGQPTVSMDSVAQDQIAAFFARWQRLEDEKKAISEDLKELFAEAKGNGFDTKVLRKVFRDKVGDMAERMEFEAIYELYAAALGMQMAPVDDDEDEPRARPAGARVEIIEEFAADDIETMRETARRIDARNAAEKLGTTVDADGVIIEPNSPEIPDSSNTEPAPSDPLRSVAAATGNDASEAEVSPGTSAPNSPVTVEGSRSTRGADVGGGGGAESTAARKDVQSGGSKLDSDAEHDGIRAPVNSGFGSHTSQGNPIAGTQAPPVDTSTAPTIAFQRSDKPIRPYCQPEPGRPCGSPGGRVHCPRCEKLKQAAEGRAA